MDRSRTISGGVFSAVDLDIFSGLISLEIFTNLWPSHTGTGLGYLEAHFICKDILVNPPVIHANIQM